MDPRQYVTYSAIGGVAWATGVTLLGFWLGRIPFVKDNIELMLIGIVLLSIVPIIVELLRARREIRRAARSASPGAHPGS
jgi:membrane-associated protein